MAKTRAATRRAARPRAHTTRQRLAERDLRLAARLEALVLSTDRVARREADPVSFPHRYEDAGDREVVALLSALLAFGQVQTIRASIARVLASLGPSPARTIDEISEASLGARLEGFVHRVYRGQDVARLLAGAAALRRRSGSLARAIEVFADDEAIEVPPALASRARLVRVLVGLGDALRGPPPPRRGLVHLVPDARRGSACKRLLLFLRWMARPADGVDLGLARLSPSALVIPLDTHVHRIARNLALTDRTDASLRTAIEITDALARLDAEDPVRFDFAICHLGVSRQCPSRRDRSLCERCALRDVCRHWR
ncbi:MAG: TIGR02757 family protein [Sandaracinus sp.]